jgi:hypothetical protein
LCAHLVKFLDISVAVKKVSLVSSDEGICPTPHAPSRPHEVLGLDLAGFHLAIFGALLNVLHQFLLLVLQFRPFAVQFALCSVQGTLVFAQTLCGRHALSKRPFNDLQNVRDLPSVTIKVELTFMAGLK